VPAGLTVEADAPLTSVSFVPAPSASDPASAASRRDRRSGGKGLSYAEAGEILATGTRVLVLAILGCDAAAVPRPAAEAALVGPVATIDGTGLTRGETNELLHKVQAAAAKVVDGPQKDACKKLRELVRTIGEDTGKKDRLTAEQGATLAAAVADTSAPLGCRAGRDG
jgi:hypothetical protein